MQRNRGLCNYFRNYSIGNWISVSQSAGLFLYLYVNKEQNKNEKSVDKLKKSAICKLQKKIKTGKTLINLVVMKFLRITAKELPLFKEKMDLSFLWTAS